MLSVKIKKSEVAVVIVVDVAVVVVVVVVVVVFFITFSLLKLIEILIRRVPKNPIKLDKALQNIYL